MSNALRNALHAGDMAAADAALSQGETLEGSEYRDLLLCAQRSQDEAHFALLDWVQKKIPSHDIQNIFFDAKYAFSAMDWVGHNAHLYQHPAHAEFDRSADLMIRMAASGDLLNAPLCKPEGVCSSDQSHQSRSREGWRLLHAAAHAKKLTLMTDLLALGAHPDGFNPVTLSQDPRQWRFAQWSWTRIFFARPLCPPALLCADFPEGLDALHAAGADFSLRGVTGARVKPVSVLELSLTAIRSNWQAGRRDEANALARFWLDKADPKDLASLAHDNDLCPAEGMLRLKGLAASEHFFQTGPRGSFNRLRFDLTLFERRFARPALLALRARDFGAFSAALRAAARFNIPFEQWSVKGRHIAMIALSFCAALPDRQTRETLFGASADRDPQAAALMNLISELGGARALFTPFAQEPGSLAHYCALGFGQAPNQACADSLAEAAGDPLPLTENPLNWALWSGNQAALDVWGSSGSALFDLAALFPSSVSPFELALERGSLAICSAMASAGCSLDTPSSKPLRSLRDLTLAAVDEHQGRGDHSFAHALRGVLACSEQAALGMIISSSRSSKARSL